jgi:hypothetical protein
MFNPFKKISKEERFWSWFIENQDRLFSFEDDQDNIFHAIHNNLARIHPNLVFEISRVVDGKREFVISADGIKAAFPFVESTFSKAPSLNKWTIVKFRPRIGTRLNIEFDDGFKLAPDDLKFALARHEDKIGIGIFVREYDPVERDKFLRAVFVLLDAALGEYDMETKVGALELHSWSDLAEIGIEGQPFDELPDSFDRAWAASLN